MTDAEREAAGALDAAVTELEQAAERLRHGALDADAAAELVDRCAELAARLGAELDRSARAAAEEAPAGQERLL